MQASKGKNKIQVHVILCYTLLFIQYILIALFPPFNSSHALHPTSCSFFLWKGKAQK